MSTEWYLQAHQNGDDQQISSALINAIVEEYNASFDNKCVDITFDNENSTSLFYDWDSEQVSNMMISRPCLHDGLAEVIYKIMKLGNFIFFAPGGEYPIILFEKIIDELPEGMIDSLGEAKVSSNYNEFKKLLDAIYD